METKFTKCDIKINDHNKSYLELIGKNKESNSYLLIDLFLYRNFFSEKELESEHFLEENLSNAKLIAAAPDLLNALIEADNKLTANGMGLKSSEQAIKKAT